MTVTKLKPADLRTKLNSGLFPFKTTNELAPLEEVIGQDRAIRAIDLALDMEHSGYNIFVTGMSGTGRTTIVRDILNKIAKQMPVPQDRIYVYNFENPDSPRALELPGGKARTLKRDMAELIKTLKKEIPSAFRSEEYDKQKLHIINQNNERKRTILNRLEQQAKAKNIQLQSTPSGFQTLVLKGNEPISSEEYEKLTKGEKQDIEKRVAEIQEKINESVGELVKLDRKSQQEIRQLDETVASYIVSRHIDVLKSHYQDFAQISIYINNVRDDIISNITEFLTHSKKEIEKAENHRPRADHFKRYEVNIIVDHSNSHGAPVIYEPNPTYNNLFGRIDKQIIMGGQFTDFTMIKGGSLHQANGGYLMTDAYQVVTNPFVYDSLKRAIKTREIRLEDVSELSGYFSAAALRPQPIPLNLKVILIGWNHLYYSLQSYDPDFNKVFKIRADFDYETDSNEANILKYGQFIKRVCDEEGLLDFHRSAVREVVYFSQSLVDDQQKLSLRFGSLVSIIREAAHFAHKEGQTVVRSKHVRRAVCEHEYRHSMIEEKVQEMYRREIYRLDVTGEKIGQINGLAVYRSGDYTFGRPHRITAKAYIGSENLVNIERKARLSGKFHDKGLLILSGFFNWKFGEYIPLSFSASLTFEQSYSTIDGDSAASTELYALISSLARAPLKQNIAVTGSVNQNGEIQAIGGVNQKIEGFFKVCQEKGLTGDQGVIIPRSNKDNLVLKDEVIEAVKKGQFHIWTIDTIEDGLKLLTGMNTGKRLRNGHFSKNSIYARVEQQLRTFSKRTAAFRKSVSEKKKKTEDKADRSTENNQETDDEEKRRS